MSSSNKTNGADDTIVARPPRRPALASRWDLHNLDFKMPGGSGGAHYDVRDPSRIAIGLDSPTDMLRLTLDEGLALRIRDDLTRALEDFRAHRTPGSVPAR
jgi:hypothetical protein